jgi:hypothetical protein
LETPTVEPNPKGKSVRLWVALACSLLLIFLSLVFTYSGEARWIGHAFASVTGLVLVLIAAVNGAILAGRLSRTGATKVFIFHKNMGLLFGFFMVGTFTFGLWITSSHGEPVMSSVHGWLGLATIIIAALQVIPRFAFKQNSKVRFPHKILGYTAVFLVVIQTAWGLEIAVVGAIKDLVMIHSTFGALAALGLTWVIVELRHLTPKGLARAKFASITAAFFNVVGCWFVGGYYYLTVYASELKPVIVGGAQPWAHQIIMETKEHVFLFLPVISLALMCTLVFLGKNQTLFEDSKTRKAITALALLALVMIIVTFVFGALISNAARIGLSGE